MMDATATATLLLAGNRGDIQAVVLKRAQHSVPTVVIREEYDGVGVRVRRRHPRLTSRVVSVPVVESMWIRARARNVGVVMVSVGAVSMVVVRMRMKGYLSIRRRLSTGGTLGGDDGVEQERGIKKRLAAVLIDVVDVIDVEVE